MLVAKETFKKKLALNMTPIISPDILSSSLALVLWSEMKENWEPSVALCAWFESS